MFIWYVSPKGEDIKTNGPKSKPVKTISYALRRLKANLNKDKKKIGQVYLAPGEYHEEIVLTSNMQLLRDDKKQFLECDIGNKTYTEKEPAIIIKRPAAPKRESVVLIHGINIKIDGIVIDGNQTGQRGMRISNSSHITVTHTKIQNCTSKIIHKSKGAGTKTDLIKNGYAIKDRGTGAGVRLLHAKNVTFDHCVISHNKTELKYRQRLADKEIEIIKKKLGTIKLALAIAAGKDPTIEGQKPWIIRNGGGNIACKHTDEIVFRNCVIEYGFSGGRGAGIVLGTKAYATIDQCLLRSNKASIDGGGIAVNDPGVKDFSRKKIVITNSVFEDNQSLDDGGGLYLTAKTKMDIKNCKFIRNRAESNGGALRITFGSELTVANCLFKENEANIDAASKSEINQDGGGAIAARNCNLIITKSSFEANKCHGFAGGAIYFITAKYNKNAEKVARWVKGYTFDYIFKKKYLVSSVECKISHCQFIGNSTPGETCYAANCDPGTKKGYKAGGAGGAIYLLQNKAFGIPVTAELKSLKFNKNPSSYRNPDYRSELTAFNIELFSITSSVINSHPSNSYDMSLVSLVDKSYQKSSVYGASKAKSKIYEKP